MPKVTIIGLDGGTFTVIDYLIGKGRLPNFQKLMREGCRAVLLSSTPPITPAAWSSFFTGTNPGKTGAVGFFKWRPGTYKLDLMNARTVSGRPIWAIASEMGRRVCVYNVPVTYPALPLNGILISGMDAPRFDDHAIYPLQAKEEFLKAVPDFSISPSIDRKYLITHSPDPSEEAIKALKAYLNMETRAVRYLRMMEDWDLFVAVFRSPDIFQHTFWDSLQSLMDGNEGPDDGKRAAAILDCYEKIDLELGEMMDYWGTERNIILMSDHGFGKLEKTVSLNRVLADAGLLKWRSPRLASGTRRILGEKIRSHIPAGTRNIIKRSLRRPGEDQRWLTFVDSLVADIDWQNTRLCSIAQYGTFYANMADRYPLGMVRGKKELEAVLTEAEGALGDLVDPDDGKPVVTRFYRKEELYHGQQLEVMPDLVTVMRDYAYEGVPSTGAELSQTAVFRPPRADLGELNFSGTHRAQGMLVFHGPDIVSGADAGPAEMVDIAPTVMNLLELPGEEDWDGKLLEAVLKLPSKQYEGSPETSVGKPGEPAYSAEDEEEVRKRLEDLGYL